MVSWILKLLRALRHPFLETGQAARLLDELPSRVKGFTCLSSCSVNVPNKVFLIISRPVDREDWVVFFLEFLS